MVFFYLVTTGWIFDISLLCENSINSINTETGLYTQIKGVGRGRTHIIFELHILETVHLRSRYHTYIYIYILLSSRRDVVRDPRVSIDSILL